tara:strand:+ start:284 stop:583 length:300 start_codon:yes stop_codon:yes gene_type:complete
MANKKPIYIISKELGIDSNKIVKACNHIGIFAKAASKRLNHYEEKKIISYFQNGKDVANETIEINNDKKRKNNQKKEEIKSELKIKKFSYFPNRLIKEI